MRLIWISFLLVPCLSPGQEAFNVAGVIGLDLQRAHEQFGVPDEVFVVRGAEDWQDDVVFYYDRYLYLFWYENQIWQVRLDDRYDGSFFNLSMGLSRAEVLQVLGKPLSETEDTLIYHREDPGYPLRMRFFFEESVLNDAYFYRGDF